MNLIDLRKKTENEISKDLDKLKVDVEKYSHEIIKGKEKNISKLKNMRRDCARIATVLTEKKLVKVEEPNE